MGGRKGRDKEGDWTEMSQADSRVHKNWALTESARWYSFPRTSGKEVLDHFTYRSGKLPDGETSGEGGLEINQNTDKINL